MQDLQGQALRGQRRFYYPQSARGESFPLKENVLRWIQIRTSKTNVMDTTTLKKLIQDYENTTCRIVLCCVAELPFPLGIKKTTSVLRGSKSAFVAKHKLHRLSTYSVLVTFARGNLRAIIETLVKAGLLKIEFVSEYKNIPVLRMTAKGQDFVAGKYATDVRFIENFIDRNIPEFEGFEKKLFDRLRKVRREIAQRKDIPAFMVCSDVILRELTKRKLTEASSLPLIRGVGEKFVQNYGDDFTKTIAACLDEAQAQTGSQGWFRQK